MATPRQLRFVYGQLAWMLAVTLALTALGALSYETFFVCSLIGFLIVAELTAPTAVSPTWRRRLVGLVLLGLAVFVAIVVRRLLEILPPEVTPL